MQKVGNSMGASVKNFQRFGVAWLLSDLDRSVIVGIGSWFQTSSDGQ